MFSDTDRGVGSSGLRLVTCDLSSLSDCCCSEVSPPAEDSAGSSRRKTRTKPLSYVSAENLTPRRCLLLRPTLIERLISRSRRALREMEGRRSVSKVPVSRKPPGKGEAVKRKRADKITNGTSQAVKRLRSTNKGGSDSDSSPSRNASIERKRQRQSEKSEKPSCSLSDKRQNVKSKPKKVGRKSKKRFSKRICCPTSSLRSGKKRMELLKRKRHKNLSKDKNKRQSIDKMDSNSNVCTENDSNDETVDNSTDSEVSRGPTDFIEKDSDKNHEEENRKKRKRRKRDSMWVKKVKKIFKGKPENFDKSLPPPALEPFHEVNNIKLSDVLEELPVLDKESDDSLTIEFVMGSSSLNTTVQDDVPMPMLVKEVEINEPSSVREGGMKKLDSAKEKLPSNNACKSMKQNEPIVTEKAPSRSPKQESLKDHSGMEKEESAAFDQSIRVKLNEFMKNGNHSEALLSRDTSPCENNGLIEAGSSENSSSVEMNLPEETCQLELGTTKSKEIILDLPNGDKELNSFDDKSNLSHTDKKSLSGLNLPSNNEPKNISECTEKDDLNFHQEVIVTPAVPEPFNISELNSERETVDSLYPGASSPSIQCFDSAITIPGKGNENLSTMGDMKVNDCDITPQVISDHRPVDNLCVSEPNCENSIKTIPDITEETNCGDLPVVNSENRTPLIGGNAVDFNHRLFNKSKCSENNIKTIESLVIHSDDSKENFFSSAQNLEEEITKLEAVLSENSDNESKYTGPMTKETDIETQNIKSSDVQLKAEFTIKTEKVPDVYCNSLAGQKNCLNLDSKDVSLLDADSTSDVKPQSLDDSFGDFSLSLPEDLESPSEDDREEELDVLPDSTECEKSEGIVPKEDQTSNNVDTTPAEPEVVETSTNQLEVEQLANASTEVKNNCLMEVENASEATEFLPIKNNCLMGIYNASEGEIDISESTILKQEFRQEKPLAGSTPRRTSSDEINEGKMPEVKKEVLTVEQMQMKESVLQALGLKSSSATSQVPVEEKPKRDGYTGTLKAVIKLNRSGDKKKMVYQRTEDRLGELEYRICSEIPATEGVPITHYNDIAGMRKNVSKLHHDSETNSLGTTTSNGHSAEHESTSSDDTKNPSGKDLIIPEKSSSFSIHPGRLCSDVCTYCFGKFGCLDTPCHVAALKAERQKKILENEQHLTAESCLCDACYRYVDRKANFPSKNSTGTSSKPRVKPPASTQCCVNGCQEQATHTVKKKWLIKLKKSIANKLDIDLERQGAMYSPLCEQHHYWVDYFTVCGICRRRLNRNHLYSLGSETDRLNLMLAEDGIPARLSDKLFLCKLCRYYSNLRLKYTDPGSIPSSGQIFYRDYRRKILTSLDIPVSDSEDEPSMKDDKKKVVTVKKSESGTSRDGPQSSGKPDKSVMDLSNLATLLGDQPEQQARIQVKFGNVNIGRLSNLNIGQSGREERLPYSEVGLQASLEFEGPAVPDGSWERCVSTIQFDKRTKKLWQDLQKPYGNQSSFLRHLVMLEKYWRAGHLALTPNADERVTKYLNGVKNRIKAFEGSSSSSIDKQTAAVPSVVTPTSTGPTSDKFPLITNTGEIEVTPITVVQKRPVVITPDPLPEKRPMTHLDRAKSLVRMVPPPQRQRFPMPMQRFQMPVYVPTYNYPPTHQHRPPPLLKIRNKPPPPYYQQIQPSPIHASQPLKPILPKLPSALTVTQVAQGGAAITLNRSGITIEKQSGTSHINPTLPIEKPSISVFREPAPGPP